MPDYSQGKIYQILNTVTDDVYIGSTTTQHLCNRIKNHRSCAKQARNNHCKLYQAFDQHGVDNFYIELIEKYPCECKEELTAREGYYMRQERPSLNTRIEGRTSTEYYQHNKAKIQEYYDDNRDAIMQKKNGVILPI